MRPGSDVSHLALLGYDPIKYYSGRGPFEAAGVGIKLRPGDLCFRANFSTVDRKGILIDRRANRIMDASVFENALNNIRLPGVEVLIKAGVSHRAALVLRPLKGTVLSSAVAGTDPHTTLVKPCEAKPTDGSAQAKHTAALINEFVASAHNALERHSFNKQRVREKMLPANMLLLRGVGFSPTLEPFENKHGLRATCIAGGAMYKGLARLVGMDVVFVRGATGRSDTDLNAKVEAVLKALPRTDFVFMHVKATDSFGEDGDFVGKRNFIERVDSALSPIVSLENTFVVVTGDHSTSCTLKAHTADPVPILISGPGVRRDAARAFGERECARGGLGRIRGLDVMKEVVNLLGRTPLYGA